MSTPDRLVTRPFLAVAAATAAFFVYVGVLVPLVPRFVEDELGGGEFGVGLAIAAFALSAIAARPLITRLADQYGRRAVMVAGGLTAGAAGSVAGLTNSLPVFLALRGLTGVGEAALFVAAATLIADLAPPHRRAEAASYFSVAVFGGIGVGPVFGEAILGDDRFVLAFATAAGFAVLAALMSTMVPDRVGPVVAAPRREGRARLIHPAAIGPGLVLGSGIAAFAVFSAFLPDHARDVGLSGSGPFFAVYSIVCVVLRIAGARLPERLGPRRSVTIALVTVAVALTLLAGVAQPWALWVSAATIGVGMAFLYPSLMAMTVDRVAPHERAAAVSSFTMFFEIGSAVGGLALGGVAELAGKRVGFLGGVVMCAAGLYLMRTYVVPRASATAPGSRPEPTMRPDAVFVPVAGD